MEALFHLRQQPALFERAFRWTEAYGTRQQQGIGFVHWPHHGVDRVAAELFKRGDALVAVDDQVSAAVFDYDDRRLLSALSQGG